MENRNIKGFSIQSAGLRGFATAAVSIKLTLSAEDVGYIPPFNAGIVFGDFGYRTSDFF
jgi:hypothetical protein